MKKLLFALMALMFGMASFAASKYEIPEYEIESAGSGVQGTYLVRVWVHSKHGKVSDEVIKRCAVHGVIFRGFAGSAGQPTQRPLTPASTEESKSEYFNAFFSDAGPYAQFGSIVAGSYQRVKASKQYKVGAVVQVRKDELRRELEASGVAKGLSSGF